MKKHVTLLLVFFCLCLAGNVYAYKLGIRAGLNVAKSLIKNDDQTFSDDFKSRPTFHFGATAEFKLCDRSAFEPSLLVFGAGYKYDEDDQPGSLSPLYLQLPLVIKYWIPVGDLTFFPQFGPYLGFGIGGKYKWEYQGQDESESIKWGSGEDDDLKPFDFGLNAGFGVKMKCGFEANLFYNYGLANHSIQTENGAKYNERVWGLSVAYKFKF